MAPNIIGMNRPNSATAPVYNQARNPWAEQMAKEKEEMNVNGIHRPDSKVPDDFVPYKLIHCPDVLQIETVNELLIIIRMLGHKNTVKLENTIDALISFARNWDNYADDGMKIIPHNFVLDLIENFKLDYRFNNEYIMNLNETATLTHNGKKYIFNYELIANDILRKANHEKELQQPAEKST